MKIDARFNSMATVVLWLYLCSTSSSSSTLPARTLRCWTVQKKERRRIFSVYCSNLGHAYSVWCTAETERYVSSCVLLNVLSTNSSSLQIFLFFSSISLLRPLLTHTITWTRFIKRIKIKNRRLALLPKRARHLAPTNGRFSVCSFSVIIRSQWCN